MSKEYNTWLLLKELTEEMAVPHIFGLEYNEFKNWLKCTAPKDNNAKRRETQWQDEDDVAQESFSPERSIWSSKSRDAAYSNDLDKTF